MNTCGRGCCDGLFQVFGAVESVTGPDAGRRIFYLKRYAMKKRSIIALLLLFLAPGTIFSDLFNRAPDVLPGTIPEMRDPGYWISRMDDPDSIVMTSDEIGRMNERYRKWSHSDNPFAGVPRDERPSLRYAWPGIVFARPDLDVQSPEAVADTVRKRIGYEIAFMRSKPFGGFDAVRLTDRQLDAFKREIALDRVPKRIAVTHAITVRTTRLRNVPTFFPMEMGMIDSGASRIEQFNITVLKIGEPLQVLHRSRSGMHVFVLSGYGYGWVKTGDVAFGEKAEIKAFLQAEPFVVCTGGIVPFYSD
ncbi:MAG: SH3 domain-containing protein, partial [Candidatus Latescibacteria bacterium]|nr:SH3 domain-containing protein [Candidatus Latescibacterota bacterium]